MKKKLRFCFLLLFMLTTNLFAQELTPIYHDTIDGKGILEISSQNYYASKSFNNAFTSKFLQGGEITKAIKDDTQRKLGNINALGAEANQVITYYSNTIHPIKNKRYGLTLSLSDNNFVSSNLSTDLFNTIMYGNAAYIGDTMDFSFSHFQYLHYQKVGFGLFDVKTKSSLRLNFIAGSKTMQGRLGNNTTLLSQADLIQLALKGSGLRTADFSPYIGLQGAGFSFDVTYNFTFNTKKFGTQALNLQVNNLGLVFWNKETITYDVDSNTTYKGFDIQDFLNREDDATTKKINVLDTLGISESKGAKRTTLPIEFVLQKMPQRNHTKKIQSIFGFKAILTSDYSPYVFAGIYYAPHTNFSASTRLSYGGFGGFQWGIHLNYWSKNKLHLSLGTFDIIGNSSKKLGYGRSVNLSAHFNL